MDYSQFILSVNAACIAILTLFTALLLASSKFKGMNGYAALVTFVPTVPVYLYNMSRMLEWYGFSQFMLPFAFSVNTIAYYIIITALAEGKVFPAVYLLVSV